MYFHFALNMPRRRISGDGCAKQDADSKAKSNRSSSSSSKRLQHLQTAGRSDPVTSIVESDTASSSANHRQAAFIIQSLARAQLLNHAPPPPIRLSHGSFRTRAKSRTKTAPEMNGFHSSNTKIFTLTEFSRKQGEINTKKSTKKTN